jgi:hypothetical protein
MNSAPPKISPSTACFVAVVLGLTAAGVAAIVYFFNPSAHSFYPVCQFHRLTGLNCPGCGGTRALYALLHGNLAAALRDNVLLVAGLAGTGLRGGWFALNRLRGRRNGEFFPPRWLLPLLVVMAVFGVLRNLPAFAFLSP